MRYVMMILSLMFGASCILQACTIQASTTNDENGEDDMARITEGKDGWQQSGDINAGGRGSQGEVSMQANFPRATNYTCQFAVQGQLGNVHIEADVTWMVEGNQLRRKISIADGVSIQGTGQAVSVRVRDASPVNGLAAVANQKYRVTVCCTPGTRGSTTNPPTYNPETPADLHTASDFPNNQITYPIPDQAGIISVAVQIYNINNQPSVSGDVVVLMQDEADNTLAVYDPTQYFWMPLAPGCTKLTITNNNTTAQYFVKPIWGIDG